MTLSARVGTALSLQNHQHICDGAGQELHVLSREDVLSDAGLMKHELCGTDLTFNVKRVETRGGFIAALVALLRHDTQPVTVQQSASAG